jgi:hypothetical protein
MLSHEAGNEMLVQQVSPKPKNAWQLFGPRGGGAIIAACFHAARIATCSEHGYLSINGLCR